MYAVGVVGTGARTEQPARQGNARPEERYPGGPCARLAGAHVAARQHAGHAPAVGAAHEAA